MHASELVQITEKQILIVFSFSRELMNVHEQHLPDPYVRLYLMPDFKKDKKKTK